MAQAATRSNPARPGQLTQHRTIFAHRLSKFLSRLALFAAALAICVTYYGILPIGYEGMVFVSSVAVVMALGAGVISLGLAAMLLILRKPPKPYNAMLIASLAIIMAVAYVWAL